MAFDPAFFVTNDRFAMPRECNWLDVKRGFLAHLANNRIRKLLAGFNATAWQSVRLSAGLRARRTISTLPSRMMAALTARTGRFG